MAKDRIEIEVLAKGVKEAQKEIENLKKSINKTATDTKKSGESMIGTFGAIAIGAFAAFQTIKKGLNLGKEFALFQQSVKAMESQFGVSADNIIKKLGEVSKGTISNADLVSAANRAMALNVTTDLDEMAQLLEVARVRGQAMGVDTTQAFNDIVTGIGRASPLILDNLGIITKGWDKEAKAAGGAFDAQFVLNKVLADGAILLAKTGDVALTAAEKFQQFEAQGKNLKLVIGQQLLPEIFKITDEFAKIGAGKGFTIIIRTVRVVIALVRFLAFQFTAIGRIFVFLITPFVALVTTMVDGFEDILKAFKAFLKPFKEFDGTIEGAKRAWEEFKNAGKLTFDTVGKLGESFTAKIKKQFESQIASGKKEFNDFLDSVTNIFAKIDKVVKDSGKKRSESGSDDVKDFKLKESEKLALQKQALQASKQLANDFFKFASDLRQAELDDIISKLNQEREAELAVKSESSVALAELDERDKQARLVSLANEKDIATEIGNEELADEKQREIDRIKIIDEQKKKEDLINKEFDAKVAKVKNDAAKKDRKAKILASLANTALAVTSALAFTIGGPIAKGIASSIIGGLGLAQTAIIRATPIPKFRHGTEFSPGGRALVGEDGPEILDLPQGSRIRPNNQINNETNDNRNIVINVASPNAIEFVNDLQQTYGLDVFGEG